MYIMDSEENFFCEYCNVDFGGRKYGWKRHLKTKKHLKNVDEAENKNSEITQTPQVKTKTKKVDKKDEQIKQLMELVKNLQSNITDLQSKPKSPPIEKTAFTEEVEVKNVSYTLDRILNRKNENIPYPREKWKSFILKAYYYEADEIETIVTNRFTCLTKASNLLIQKFKDCKKEELPILVLNKRAGISNKIAYYENTNGVFTTRTNVEKRKDIQLWRVLNAYLGKSQGQFWDEKHLKEIYRDLPIEIRDKMFYTTRQEGQLSFLDFWCEHGHNDICIGCYKDSSYCDMSGGKLYTYKNTQLISPQGQKFKLTDESYKDFVEEYLSAITNHENYEIFLNYKKQQNTFTELWGSQNDDLDSVTDELFDIICDICNINNILN